MSEAALALGQTERQVRYLIQQGRLRASKKQGRWVIEPADLPLSADQRRALGEKADAVKTVAEKAVAKPAEAMAKAASPRFSVRDLRAYKATEPVYRDVVAALGPDDPAAALLREALELLAQGCHCFHAREKIERYGAARERAAAAVMRLLLGGPPGDSAREALAASLEQKALPDLSGLIRVTERVSRRDRFDRFGSTR